MTDPTQAETGEKPEQPQKQPRPPRMNGPAVLVFGVLMIVGGLSIKFNPMMYAGAAFMLLGAWGIYRTKRYEKAQGIEDVLPGGGRYDAKGDVIEEDDSPQA